VAALSRIPFVTINTNPCSGSSSDWLVLALLKIKHTFNLSFSLKLVVTILLLPSAKYAELGVIPI